MRYLFRLFITGVVCVSITSCGELETTDEIDDANPVKENKYDIRFVDVPIQNETSVKIFLSINDKNYPIDEISGMGVSSIPFEEFSNYDIPSNAISAIQGFWAGLQSILYIKDDDTYVSVRKAEYDETELGFNPVINYEEIFRVNKDEKKNYSTENKSNTKNGDFYIVSVAAIKDENKTKLEVEKLRSKGYSADYLWIPDYNSLSRAEYYCAYIGPFFNQKDCELAVSQYQTIDSKVYGLLVSQQNKRVQINGINNVKITEPYHEDIYFDSQSPESEGGEAEVEDEKDEYYNYNTTNNRSSEDISDYVKSTAFKYGDFRIRFYANGIVNWKISRGSNYGTEMQGSWQRYSSSSIRISNFAFVYGQFDPSNNPDLSGTFYLRSNGTLDGSLGDYQAQKKFELIPE